MLHNALRKYGFDAFTYERLGIYPLESLTNMEAYWAEQLETYIWDSPGGYNMVWCDKAPRLGIKNSAEHNEKTKKGLTGKKLSEQHRESISIGKKKQKTI